MNKKKLILLVLLILFFSSYYFYLTQKNNTCVDINSVTSRIENIENNLSKYYVIEKDILDRSTEGGQQTNYIFEKETKLVKQIFFGETGKSEITFYLDKNKVFYINKVNTEYVLPIYKDSSGEIKNVVVKEFYLDQNQNLCSWYQNKKLQEDNQDTRDLIQYLVSSL